MEILDKAIYQAKDGAFLRIHGKDKLSGDDDYILYQCDFDGNYDPDIDDYSGYSLVEIQRELVIVGTV